MEKPRNAKSWIEVILMPLVVAIVGILGTYLVTNEQKKSAELRAIADRQVRIIEIFADKITSENVKERLLAIGLTGTLDAELSTKLMAIAIDRDAEQSAQVRDAIDQRTAQAISTRLAADKGEKAGAWSILEGRWLLRRQGMAPEKAQIVNWMEFRIEGNTLKVFGDTWQGKVSFDGQSGFYSWAFEDGRTGKTDIYLDSTGILFGHVKGSGLDWTYWASRELRAEKSSVN